MSLPTHEDPLETRLREAGSRPVPVRPLDDVETRARRLRRNRRAARGGAVTALVAATVTGVAIAAPTLLGGPATDRGNQPAVASSPAPSSGSGLKGACRSGTGYTGDFTDVPDLLFLPSAAVLGKPALSRVALSREDCDPAPVAAVVGRSAGEGPAMTAGVVITGPDAAGHYADGGFQGEVRAVTDVPGTLQAYLMDLDPGQPRELVGGYWIDPDGQAWWLATRGVTADELRAVVAGLSSKGGRLELGGLPEEFDVRVGAADLRQPARDSWSFHVSYGTEGRGAELAVRRGTGDVLEQAASFAGNATGVRLEVLGKQRRGLWVTEKEPVLIWEGDSGTLFTLRGVADLAEARRIAESVSPTTATDPALVASRGPERRDVPAD